MSLIQTRRVAIAGAAAVAMLIPHLLLGSEPSGVSVRPPMVITPLDVKPAAALNLAYTAPIFSPSRTPADEIAASDVEEPPPIPVPSLVGVISRSKGRGVVLVKGSDGQTVTLAQGEAVDGWRLATIALDRATFVRNGERQEAMLDFGNKAPDAQESAPAVRSSAPQPNSPMDETAPSPSPTPSQE